MAHLSLYRYRIVATQWESLTRDEAQAIAEAANNALWFGSKPHRFGLKECVALETPEVAIFGFYTQETEREQRTLTEGKGEQIQTEEHAEKYLFALLPNARVLSLQAKRVPDMPSHREIVEKVGELLRLAFSKTFRNFGYLERIEEGTPSEAYREVFFSSDTERVTFLRLRELDGEVPDDFPYFNPNFDLNQAFREASLRDRTQLLEVSLVATPDGNLKRSPSARGYIQAARNPREMRVIKMDGSEQVLRTHEEGTIRVQTDEAELRQLTRPLAESVARATANPRAASPVRQSKVAQEVQPVKQASLFE